MPKSSRRAGRRNRPRPVRARQRASQLLVAIVRGPPRDGVGASLRRDVELARASVPYADEIELISIPMARLASVFQLAAAGEAGVHELVRELPDDTLQAIAPDLLALANWRETVHSLPAPEIPFERAALVAKLHSAAPDIEANAHAMLTEAEGEELLVAIDAGVLTLSDAGFGNDPDGPVAGWAARMRELLTPPSPRVLFDGTTASDRRERKGAAEAAARGGLVGRLPAFPQTPLDELLDLRRDLSDPLTRYRRATSQLATKLSSQVFDAGSAEEIDDLWATEVAPVLLEIEAQYAEHGLVRELARSMNAELSTLIVDGPALWIGFDAHTAVQARISAALALEAPGIPAAAPDAHSSGSEVFFLYESGE